jgi:hypothetical protein
MTDPIKITASKMYVPDRSEMRKMVGSRMIYCLTMPRYITYSLTSDGCFESNAEFFVIRVTGETISCINGLVPSSNVMICDELRFRSVSLFACQN